jgi:hypothetical protein
MPLPRYTATRYVLPLREGGSLPAIAETDGDGAYVVKFVGAGQGPKSLVAEALAAGLARALDLPVPPAAVIDLGDGFGDGEPNPEIQDLLRASVGANFGLAYLPGALGFDPVADADRVDADLAASIVWFDALITNVDRTPRNPNLLVWNDALWMIDHGVAFYFQYLDVDWLTRAEDRFPQISEHILLAWASSIEAAHARLAPRLDDAVLRAAVDAVPDEWLGEGAPRLRDAYVAYLLARLSGRLEWLEEAERARSRAS